MYGLRGKKRLTVPVFLFLALLATAVEAQTREPVDVHALGPQVGERVPDFRLPDQHGQLQNLESILGPNGAMLLFHRSADW